MTTFVHVVRHFVDGPLDGQFVESHDRPQPYLGAVVANDGLVHRYVLTAWRIPEATYTYCGPEIFEEANHGQSH